jgi:DnaJ like chaperone protein
MLKRMSIWSNIAEAIEAIGDSVAGFLASLSTRRVAEPERTAAFTIGMIALGAKMAKADGQVTPPEISAFKEVFRISPSDLKHVARVFNLAKQDVAGFEFYARQMQRLFAQRPRMLEDILDGLFHIATADGVVDEKELAYLGEVARIFHFSQQDFARIKARHVPPGKEDPYVILGIDPHVSDEELRRHYRRLVRAGHPDRHIAAGMPAEMVRIATERLARINAAYETVAKGRGL